MKILVLGDPKSFWVSEYVKNVVSKIASTVYLHDYFFNQNHEIQYSSLTNVTILKFRTLPKIVKSLPGIRTHIIYFLMKKDININGPFDIIINMFVSKQILKLSKTIKTKKTIVYAYFCGSDILKATKHEIVCLNKYLKDVDKVVCASSNVMKAYMKKIGFHSTKPVTEIRLGISTFQYIYNTLVNIGKKKCKRLMNIDEEKKTICIGYNASQSQNHLQVLQQVSFLPRALLDKVTIILQLMYGGDIEYIKRIEDAALKINCEVIILKKYMDVVEISKLRVATDVFINSQDTDGLSASVLESIYAGASLINASWLDYNEFFEWGLKFRVFSKYDEIPNILIDTLLNTDESDDYNRDILNEYMSWHSCAKLWLEEVVQSR